MICFWKNPKIFWAVLCQLGNHWIIWWHINAQMGLVHLQIWATPLLQVMRRHSAQLKENEYLQQSLFSWKSHKSKTEVTITWQVCTSPAVASQHWARCHCDALPPLHAPHPRWKAACSRQGVYQVHSRVYLYLNIVHNFVRKHIISPSTLVSETRPLVLVGWGCRLEMGQVDEHEVPMSMLMPIFSWDSETLVNLWHIVWWSFIWMMTMMQITVISFQVVDFIKKHGLNGPEGKYPKEGQYTQVSDQKNVA